MVGDFNILLSIIHRLSTQKMTVETLDMSSVRADLMDIYRTFQQMAVVYALFLRTHGTLSRIDPIDHIGLKSYHISFLTAVVRHWK